MSPTLIAALVSIVIGFGGGWVSNGWRLDAKIATIKQQNSEAVTEKVKEALAETVKYQKAKDEALKKAEQRAILAAASDSAARAKSERLQSQLDSAAANIPVATYDSLRAYATTLNSVFGECQREYREMGKEATGHASSSLTLQMMFPKQTEPKNSPE